MNTTETMLTDQKDLRDQCIDRTEILDKVKSLFLIPKLDMMTTRQVAEYYEVDLNVIQQCYNRNKDEINSDGTMTKRVNDFIALEADKMSTSKKGVARFRIDENTIIEIPYCGVKCFSKRAILRIGMLLRDSKIAQEVRTQLLNTFEHSTEKQRTAEIETEESIILEIAHAYARNDIQTLLLTTQKHLAYKNRHITELQSKVNDLEPKGKYYDIILRCKDAISITQIAKDYGKSGSWMNSKLRELKVQYYQNGTYLLYQKYAGNGYTVTKTFPYEDKFGKTRATIHTYWTQAGRRFLYDLLKKEGILPCIEQ